MHWTRAKIGSQGQIDLGVPRVCGLQGPRMYLWCRHFVGMFKTPTGRNGEKHCDREASSWTQEACFDVSVVWTTPPFTPQSSSLPMIGFHRFHLFTDLFKEIAAAFGHVSTAFLSVSNFSCRVINLSFLFPALQLSFFGMKHLLISTLLNQAASPPTPPGRPASLGTRVSSLQSFFLFVF